MPMMIILNKEILRICPANPNKLEYSTTQGKNWVLRYVSNLIVGEFKDLLDTGKELIATTSTGIFYSTNNGRSWVLRQRN